MILKIIRAVLLTVDCICSSIQQFTPTTFCVFSFIWVDFRMYMQEEHALMGKIFLGFNCTSKSETHMQIKISCIGCWQEGYITVIKHKMSILSNNNNNNKQLQELNYQSKIIECMKISNIISNNFILVISQDFLNLDQSILFMSSISEHTYLIFFACFATSSFSIFIYNFYVSCYSDSENGFNYFFHALTIVDADFSLASLLSNQ